MSEEALALISRVIVGEGRSYADAVRYLEREGDKAAAPYRDAAEQIRQWLKELS